MARARVHINEAALRAYAQTRGRAHMIKVGEASSAVAKRLAPVDTGRLRQSIGYRVTGGVNQTTRVSSGAKYSLWVHEGRGEIRPKRARVLAWRRGGRWHFAQRVRPMRGRPYLRRAVEAVTGKRVKRI